MTPDKRLVGVSIEGRCGCGIEPTCVGVYEGAPIALGCDGCCGHGNEDGWCVDVVQERHAREIVAAEARGVAQAIEVCRAMEAESRFYDVGPAEVRRRLESKQKEREEVEG